MKPPVTPTIEPPTASEQPPETKNTPDPEPQAWEEFLEDDADCCGGCNHKPR